MRIPRRGGLPRPPGLGLQITSDARMKWCAGCARDIAFVGWRTRDGRTVGDAGAVGQARRLRLARPGNHPTEGASRTPPPTVGAKRALRRVRQRMQFPHASQWCAGCARGIAYVGGGRRQAHRKKRGCNRSCRADAPNAARRSRERGAPRTVHPTGGSLTGLAA